MTATLPDVRQLRLLADIWAQAEALADRTGIVAEDWAGWHSAIFGETGAPLAQHHRDLWAWAWAIEPGEPRESFIAIWARGGAKSSSAERIAAMVGARATRSYCLYVCATQSQADNHVDAIGATLESPPFQKHYPQVGRRDVNKYGASKGWRRSRLRTASGFTVDALGLDTAARGIRIEDQRPDFIILDDVDEDTDTAAAIEKKIKAITGKILPAGSTDMVALFVQNQIHEDSIASQLLDGRAKFLTMRVTSGPHPAIRNLETEPQRLPDGRRRDVITGGVATWLGQGIKECQDYIDKFGLDSFLIECQHEVGVPLGGLFDGVEYRRCDPGDVPDLVDVIAVVDPAVTSTDRSDSHGISIGGITATGYGYNDDGQEIVTPGITYVQWSNEEVRTPEASIRLALKKAIEFKASRVIVETDQGGDLWEETYHRIVQELRAKVGEAERFFRMPGFEAVRAGSIGSKIHRANMMLAAYKAGEIVHVRNPEQTHLILEKGLRRFPKRKPFDLVDSNFWLWHSLANGASLPGFW